MIDDSGRVGPLRGEYEEEDDNDESWHDAKEDGWETVSYGQGQYGAAVEEEARVEEEEVENRHVRGTVRSRFHFRWDTIRTWIGWPKQDRGMNPDDEETKAMSDKGTEKSIQEDTENKGVRAVKSEHDITKDVRGQPGREGVPWDKAATSKVAGSTDTDVGEAMYLFEKVRGAERNTKCAMWPCKGRATSTGMIYIEVQCMIVPDQGRGRGKTSVDQEHTMRYPADSWEGRGSGLRSHMENTGSQKELCENRIWWIGWRKWFGEHQ